MGGRSGAVIEVTNLNDSGAGSLRACVTASGPRTCVFRVGGTINLLSRLYITSPFLTVAGQTAPGGGILLSGKNMAATIVQLRAHDVVWRYTRMRKGVRCGAQSPTDECGAIFFAARDSYNVILDHNSASWNEDESLTVYGGSRNFTFSYNIVAEGLGNHSTGFGVGGAAGQTDMDFHHNLTMNNSHRNPILGGQTTRHVNNITYNTRLRLIQIDPVNGFGPSGNVDIIGNLFKKRPLNSSGSNPYEVTGLASTSRPVTIHLSLNKGYTQPNPTGDQWIMVRRDAGQNGPDAGPAPTSWRRTTPLAKTAYPIIAEPVANIEGSILPIVGASRRLACDGSWVANRDSVDTRLINQYKTNTGISSVPSNEASVGGFPSISGGTPCTDTDHDGMPDGWETARGLNPNNAADRNAIAGSGYTNLEVYLAGTGSGTTSGTTPPPPPPPPPLAASATSTYHLSPRRCHHHALLCKRDLHQHSEKPGHRGDSLRRSHRRRILRRWRLQNLGQRLGAPGRRSIRHHRHQRGGIHHSHRHPHD